MKKHILYPILLATALVLSLQSCIGDQGNILNSYDVGSIMEYNGQPVIKTDNINIYITGSGINCDQSGTQRCLALFTIDWDNQPENAYSTGVYSAQITIQESWATQNYLDIASKPFAGSDSIMAISEPYITEVGGNSIITFQSTKTKGVNTTIEFAQSVVNEAQRIVTIDYTYYKGASDTELVAETKWSSFTLPEFSEEYTLLFRFKSQTAPTFKNEAYLSPDGDKNKNCYIYSIKYKPTESK